MILRSLPFLALVALVACGPSQPPSRATAERLCTPEARNADGISGSIGIGGGSGGARTTGGITLTSDLLNPRSEADALEDCIRRRMGGDNTPPRRPTFSVSIGGDI